MPNAKDPANVGEIKRKVFQKIKKILKTHGLSLARCGPGTEIKGFDEDTGFWNSKIANKPPRWIVQFRQKDDQWSAQVPGDFRSHQLGYYNVSKRPNVGATSARIVPVFNIEGTWKVDDGWEWLVVVFFKQPLEGSSSEIVSGFSPPSLELECNETQVIPIAVHVYSLCSPDSSCSLSGVEMTYGAATQLLEDLFGVSEEKPSVSNDPSSDVE